jgi:hypothetical protein
MIKLGVWIDQLVSQPDASSVDFFFFFEAIQLLKFFPKKNKH